MSEPVAPQAGANLSDMVRGHAKQAKGPEVDQQVLERDQFIAQRGELARKLVESEYWKDLILPAIETLYDQYHQARLGGNMESAGGEKFAEDLVTILGGYEKLGRRAIHRIAERAFGKDNVLPFQEKKRG